MTQSLLNLCFPVNLTIQCYCNNENPEEVTEVTVQCQFSKKTILPKSLEFLECFAFVFALTAVNSPRYENTFSSCVVA